MRGFYSSVLLLGGLFLGGCDALTSSPNGEALRFTSDATLAQRLQRVDGPSTVVAGKGSSLTLDVVGKVAPMVINDQTTFANGIQYVGGKVFVSYITPGNAFGGGVDLLDPSDPLNAASAKSSWNAVFDVSSVAVDGDRLFVGGSVKEGTDTDAGKIRKENGAVLLQTFVSDMERTAYIVNLQSGDVTDVALGGGNVYATTGAEGRAYTLSATLKSVASWEARDLRAIVPTPAGVYALASGGLFHRRTPGNGNGSNAAYTRVAEVPALIERGIARMAYADGYVYVPLNRGGLSVVETATNKEVTRVEGGTFTGVAPYEQFVFVANADGGLVAYEWNAERTRLTDVRRIDLDGLEANHLVMANGYLFVAAADGGVRIVRVAADGAVA